MISPGCAALAITTPANGARTTVLSTPRVAMCRLATGDLRVALRGVELRAQRVALGDGLVVLRLRHQLLPHQPAQARDVGLGLAQLRLHAGDLAARGADLRRGEVALRVGVDRVERRQHLSGLHRWPSSISTSRTLPVIFDDTVAMRRAIT